MGVVEETLEKHSEDRKLAEEMTKTRGEVTVLEAELERTRAAAEPPPLPSPSPQPPPPPPQVQDAGNQTPPPTPRPPPPAINSVTTQTAPLPHSYAEAASQKPTHRQLGKGKQRAAGPLHRSSLAAQSIPVTTTMFQTPNGPSQSPKTKAVVLHAATNYQPGLMRRWIEEDNETRIMGIRWLLRGDRRVGKPRSSLVIYHARERRPKPRTSHGKEALPNHRIRLEHVREVSGRERERHRGGLEEGVAAEA